MTEQSGRVARPLRVALIGSGARALGVYAPIIAALPEWAQLVSVWSRSEAGARRAGEQLGVPHFSDLGALVRETAPDLAVVSVSYAANGEAGLMAAEAGLHLLLETPIAHTLAQADAIIAAARARGRKIEVAEQFHRRPLEQIKLALIARGVFGRVHSSFNDFAGHGYHGVSVLRSYLGFGVRPLSVTGMVREYGLAPHWSRLSGTRGARGETQEHALIDFEGGQLGVFHWTDVGYDSALRWWRSSRFLAERGMGVTVSAGLLGTGLDTEERLSLLTPDGEAASFVTLSRVLERNDGGALLEMVAHTADPAAPTVRWANPLSPEALGRPPGQGPQLHDDELAVAACLLSLLDAIEEDTQPSYGAAQARTDQAVVLALRLSARRGGEPVTLNDPQLDGPQLNEPHS